MIDYLEQGPTVNGAYYAGTSRMARPRNRKKEARKTDSRFLRSALANTSQVTMTAATKCRCDILPHLSYSPDMASSDFYLFPKLKSHLRGTQYGCSEGVIEAVYEYLGDKEKAFYFGGIRKLE